MNKILQIDANRRGLHEFTTEVARVVAASDVEDGLCTLFIRHTSASLLIQENADPSARHDLEQWLDRLVVRDDPLYTHCNEGPDDMPGHIKSMLTQTSLSIPVMDGRLVLGSWQGIFLWEHRDHAGPRQIVCHL